MFTVTFYLHVHSCFAGISSGDVFLEKTVQLPFPPYKGLTVYGGGDWSAKIEDRIDSRIVNGRLTESTEICEVCWMLETQSFRVYLPDDKTIYYADLAKKPHPDFQDLVESYVQDGWERPQ